MVSVGDPVPDVLLIDEAGGEASLPSDGEVLFLSGAFRPGVLESCRAWAGSPAVVVVLPDAPPIAKAWTLRAGPGMRVLSDHRPRGEVAGRFAFVPDGDDLGLRVRVADGRIVECASLQGALAAAAAVVPAPRARALAIASPSAAPASPPVPAPQAAPTAAATWWPAVAATVAWVVIAVGLAQTASPGAAP